jgi:membrane-bound acyltransferase YfiQ involved in biofilm formation
MASQVTESQLLPPGADSSTSGPDPGRGPATNGQHGLGSENGPVSVQTGYLTMFDLFRVLACACVLGQHSLLWTDMSNNVVGTACITFLHFTRNSFFFLSGLVVCYAQITRPRTVGGFWVRRYVQMGIPYLAWTGIYLLFTILRPGGSWSHWGTYLWSDLRLGYYQLYVVVVLFQFYLVFPFLLKLLKSTSTRQHVLIMAISVAIALFIGTDLHYQPDIGVVGHYVHDIGAKWVWSRNLISYQVYFVAGVLVAYHFEAVCNVVRRWSRWVLAGTAVAAVGTMLWYGVVIARGATTGSASDIFEPIAVAWSFAAIAGLFALSVRWKGGRSRAIGNVPPGSTASSSGPAPRSRLGPGRLHLPSITYLAGLTGGFYLCHILFLNMTRAALYSSFVGGEHLPWPIRTAIFYVGTVVVAATFVALILRTPLRWVLGGPVRSEQRVRDNAEFAALRAARANGRDPAPSGLDL